MFDRIIITLVIFGSLGLLWLGWQYYKLNVMQTIQAVESSTGKPTLLYFTGEYCAICKFHQTPIMEQVATKLGQAITIKIRDVSTHPDLASQYKVLTLPTTVILSESGQVRYINYGIAGQDKLETQLINAIAEGDAQAYQPLELIPANNL